MWENIKGFFAVFPGKKRRNVLHSQFKAHSAVIQASCIINLFSVKSLNFLAMLSFMMDSRRVMIHCCIKILRDKNVTVCIGEITSMIVYLTLCLLYLKGIFPESWIYVFWCHKLIALCIGEQDQVQVCSGPTSQVNTKFSVLINSTFFVHFVLQFVLKVKWKKLSFYFGLKLGLSANCHDRMFPI